MRRSSQVSSLGLVGCLVAASVVAAGPGDVFAICPRPEHQENWGSLLACLRHAGVETEQSTDQHLPAQLDGYRLIAIAVSEIGRASCRERVLFAV